MFRGLCSCVCLISLAGAAEPEPDGSALYQQHCALCHQNAAGDNRAPMLPALRMMSAANVVLALDTGLMKEQARALTATERQRVAEFVTGKPMESGAASNDVGACATGGTFALSGASWNGWSADRTNTRFQPQDQAGITAAEVPRLQLKWAFAFPNAAIVNAQASVVGGRVFIGSANRKVYSLDAKSGCRYWTFDAQGGVRTAINVVEFDVAQARAVAFFADSRSQAYAVDAATGALLWKVQLDAHPLSRPVGSPTYHDGKLFVPLTAAEEGLTINPQYECCTSRGMVVALDARNGAQLWKAYMIDETPKVTGKNAVGTQTWGPSGASVWSAPTIDVNRNRIYVATGDNFSWPPTSRSDAIVALDMDSGKILWASQGTRNDMWNNSCLTKDKTNCPKPAGPDYDFASPAMLTQGKKGKPILLAGQKSGVAFGLDPERRGKILWKTKVGQGGIVGGIQFGVAADDRHFYVAVSDLQFATDLPPGRAIPSAVDSARGGGLYALDIDTGKRVWAAKPAVCDPQRVNCSPAQSAALTVIPGVVFSGAVDGHLRAYRTHDGKVIWDFDTVRDYATVNAVAGKGGSLNGPGPAIVDGMLYVASGYSMGIPGNMLLAFSVDGK